MTGYRYERERALGLLAEAGVLRENDQHDLARDKVAEAGVWATLALGVEPVTASPGGPGRIEDEAVSALILDPAVVAYGEVVNADDVTSRLADRGRDAGLANVGNELGRAATRGHYVRVRRGWYMRVRS